MPPKKNIKKVKSKKETKSKTKATTIDNRKISNKSQNQSVNVNVNVGGKASDRETKSKAKVPRVQSSKKEILSRSTAPTIIPQYVQGNPPPFPPQPPNRVVQPIYNPIRPAPMMTSLGSLDTSDLSSLTATQQSIPSQFRSFSPISVGISRQSNSYDPFLSSSQSSITLDDGSGLFDFRSVGSVSSREPSYAISEPISELSEESYKYSTGEQSSLEQTPSGINLQSVGSIGSGMMVPIPRTEFMNMPYNITQEDSFDDVAKLVKESISKSLLERMSRPRPPLREIIYDDGSIQVISEGQEQPLMLEMSMADQPAPDGIDEEEYKQMSVSERVQEIENRRRGRKPGTKNRPRELIQAEQEEKERKRREKEEKRREMAEREMRREEERQRRSEFITNRYDQIDRRIEKIEKKAGL